MSDFFLFILKEINLFSFHKAILWAVFIRTHSQTVYKYNLGLISKLYGSCTSLQRIVDTRACKVLIIAMVTSCLNNIFASNKLNTLRSEGHHMWPHHPWHGTSKYIYVATRLKLGTAMLSCSPPFLLRGCSWRSPNPHLALGFFLNH